MRKLTLLFFMVFVALVGVLASLPLSAQIRDVPFTPSLLLPVETAELRGQNTVLFSWSAPATEEAVTKYQIKVKNKFGGIATWNAKYLRSWACDETTCTVDTGSLPPPNGGKAKFIPGIYDWSVVAINAGGKSVAATRMFLLYPPLKPEISAPTPNEVITANNDPSIEWTYNAADDPVKFQVTLYNHRGRVKGIVSIPYASCSGGTCNTSFFDLKNGDYTVKLKLMNKAGSKKTSVAFTIDAP